MEVSQRKGELGTEGRKRGYQRNEGLRKKEERKRKEGKISMQGSTPKERRSLNEEKCGNLKKENSCLALIGREFYHSRPPIHGCGSANLVSMAEPIHAQPS